MKIETALPLLGMIVFGSILVIMTIWPEKTIFYIEAQKAMQKEAYEHGFMTKEITKDDQVIYKWKDSYDK